MDSSIVSFNNDSTTFQTTLKAEQADYNNVNVHELALHAMRDRCLLLQRRINALENDNMRLKLVMTKNESSPYGGPLQDDEKFLLQQKIAELTKQKSQLIHHVFMVSCENKNLWNKLSSLKPPDKTNKTKPLLRTNTFINSTPKTSAHYQEKYSESSLEEISLKLINSYIEEKSQLVEQYEQMAQLQDDGDMVNMASIGFAYMEDPATDSLKEIRNQTEKLHALKQELNQQEMHLKSILNKVEYVVDGLSGYKCQSCIELGNSTLVAKSKEINSSLSNWEPPGDSNTYNHTYKEPKNSAPVEESDSDVKEPFDKICPMCGQTFQKEVIFSDFQSHVESHFTGEPELDSMTDKFENVPSSFDNML